MQSERFITGLETMDIDSDRYTELRSSTGGGGISCFSSKLDYPQTACDVCQLVASIRFEHHSIALSTEPNIISNPTEGS
jgi:hypothetical protein